MQLGRKNKCFFRVAYNFFSTGGSKMDFCPNGRKKSHCMLARRAACSQLRLGDAIGRNVHTARVNERNCSYRSLQRTKCSYRSTLDCLTLRTRHNRYHAALDTQPVIVAPQEAKKCTLCPDSKKNHFSTIAVRYEHFAR